MINVQPISCTVAKHTPGLTIVGGAVGGIVGGAMSGVASGAMNSGGTANPKYTEALNIISPEVNPNGRLKKYFTNYLENKGKTVTVVENKFEKGALKKFEAPNKKKKYSKIDFRFLADTYQLDELLIVNVQYGLHSDYSYGIETGTYANTSIIVEIVNLKDNSILYKDYVTVGAALNKDWNTPPEYMSLKSSISKSVYDAVAAISKIKVKN